MTLNTEKLTSFAQAVGSDIMEVKPHLQAGADKSELGQAGITQQQLDTAIAGVKTAILGDGVPEELDTLKRSLTVSQMVQDQQTKLIVSKMTRAWPKIH
ncbi:MAG: hypothetical protein ACLRZG_07030 [Streptococcus sp.]